VPGVTSEVRIEPFDLLAHAEEARALQTAALLTVSAVTGVGAPDGEVHYDRHAARDGFRAVAAHAGDELVGFAYGYHETPGSWWDSWVRPALQDAGTDHLLSGAFELVELHVAPAHHGHGLGRRLLTALLDGVTRPRVLLTTQDGANPARGFYAHLGFVDVARLTYGADVPFVVMAADLPLRQSA
jgi:GNAT superfamily N-acetyltransferase